MFECISHIKYNLRKVFNAILPVYFKFEHKIDILVHKVEIRLAEK